MLDNIKSNYFIDNIFSIITSNHKLRIIKYNKKLQNILGIELKNYQICSGKYIIYESQINAKEYNSLNKSIIFEGEYSKGKRNGKGKEYYDNGNIKYIGEYLNGKRNGKGKEYYENGLLYFEGEYLNNKKWNGVGYDENNNIIYELKEGNGKIKKYINNVRSIFVGEYKNGEKNGKGKAYNKYGELIFEGEYLNGQRHGKGK